MEAKKSSHWRKLLDSKYLGSYDLESGQELILTIKEIKKEPVVGKGGITTICAVCYFEEDVKPMILNVENLEYIENAYGTPHVADWLGKLIQVYVKPNISYNKKKVDGLRIRDFIPVKPDEKKIKAIKAISSIEELTSYYQGLSDKDKQVYESYLKDKKFELTKNKKG